MTQIQKESIWFAKGSGTIGVLAEVDVRAFLHDPTLHAPCAMCIHHLPH